MKTQLLWNSRLLNEDKTPRIVYDLAFSPFGDQLICASGERVLVWDVAKGVQIESLAGHKANVYCVSYSKDGRFFASGAADKQVIIWSSANFEGTLRYNHNDSIQAMAFNPVTGHLASCSHAEIGIYSPEHRSISKHKVNSRVLTCSWTADGQYLALGLYNGTISIRNKIGEEKVKIDRPGGSPVWSLTWHPTRDQIAVADWGQCLSFYALNGTPAAREKSLGFDPCCVSYYGDGDYMLIGGANRKASMFSKDGIMLATICDQPSWVWCCKQQPESNVVAVGCQDGSLSVYALHFNTIHGLYRDRYAFRDSMTNVTVQHLPTDSTVTIRCKELVKRLSVYRNRLAVQLPSSVLIYELKEDLQDLQYKMKERVALEMDCNLLVVTASHIVLCQERRLQSFRFDGQKDREWAVESFIRYIKVIGGPAGSEGMLCGLKNGEVVKIFMDNPFIIPVLRMKNAVRCLDVSARHSKVAVVDETNLLQVYSLSNSELLYQEPGATSVSWNTQNEDMLCYSGGGTLHIKTANFPPHQQKLMGFVVGFSGSKIFCLQGNNITSIDVPQSASLYQYLEKQAFKQAYSVACLGVTNTDWELLAAEALEGLDFETARKAYVRIRDLRYLELIANIEERQRRGENDRNIFLADIHATRGNFNEAADLYEKNGQADKAVEMYTDLRMFDKAKEIVKRSGKKNTQLTQVQRQEAEWFKHTNDPQSACKMYLAVGEYSKAINIMGHQNWTDQLVQLIRSLDASHVKELQHAARMVREQNDQWEYAIEAYRKIDDLDAQIGLYVELEQWDSVFNLCKERPELKERAYVPYANWLAEHDRFEEAQQAFHTAGRDEDAVRVLTFLTDNAIRETRYSDASYYYYMLSLQHRDMAQQPDTDEEKVAECMERFSACRFKAELYYIFSYLHAYLIEPFTKTPSDALFNMARYLLLETETLPSGVSKAQTLIALAKQSRILGAFKLARFCYERLQGMSVPRQFRKDVERESMTIRAKEMVDKPELLPLCYRCSTSNPLVHSEGRKCINCFQPFTYEFGSFDLLPIVEFYLEADISDEEALQLISTDPPRQENSGGWQEEISGDVQRMRLAEEPTNQTRSPFDVKLMNFEPGGSEYVPIVADRETLLSVERRQVLVKRWPAPMRFQFFKALVAGGRNIATCPHCLQFFHNDEFCVHVLEKGRCPFCRTTFDTDKRMPTSCW